MAGSSFNGEEPRDASGWPSNAGRRTLTKEDRIRHSSEIRRVLDKGFRYQTPHFVLRILRNPLGIPRLGIVASRKVGNACARNRVKRRLREYFRRNRNLIPPDADVVFIVRKGAPALDSHHLAKELNGIFSRKLRA